VRQPDGTGSAGGGGSKQQFSMLVKVGVSWREYSVKRNTRSNYNEGGTPPSLAQHLSIFLQSICC
jgi:hypothetical protein